MDQSEHSLSSTDLSLRKKGDSDSIVRGILSNSIKYNHEKQAGLIINLVFFQKFLYSISFVLR